MTTTRKSIVALALTLVGSAAPIAGDQSARPAQPPTREAITAAPNRRADEGKGPFKTLTIRGVMVIDGTGGPPSGPMDVMVSGNRITAIRSAGTPGLPMREDRGPKAEHEVDATGMYLMPGFVDMHVHAGGGPKNQDAEYAYKLWLAHGVTTVRGVALAANDFTVKEKERSAKNEIVAPRIYNYQRPGSGWDQGPVDSPDKARAYVRWAAANGVDGLKLGADRPGVMAALLDEAKKTGLGSTAHLQQGGVAQMNAIKAARLGLNTVTHFYGHFESLLKDYVVQPWPVDMNAADEQWRFGQVARLWDKIHEPGSPQWKAYLEEHLKLGTVFDPTLTIYSAGRDLMKFRNADWHDQYTLPSLMDFYAPSRTNHGAYWYYWTTEDEVAWRNYYQVWFRMLNDYKKMGGRVTTGSDSGFIYQTYGFGFINELEMLQEAGFHPLEVLQAATMNGAITLHEPTGKAPEFGMVRTGMLADMVIVDQNPLQNFKVLYGTGALKLNDKTGKTEQVGGVRFTIKDGIVYDAKQLLADVAAMVEKQKRSRGSKPATHQIDYTALWDQAMPFDRFLHSVRVREGEWKSRFANAAVSADVLNDLRALKGKRRILVVATDTCSDSAWAVPYVAKLAAAVPERLELRVIGPGEGSRIQSANLTPDGRIATPTIVVLDELNAPIGAWVERPGTLQAWVIKNGATVTSEVLHDHMDAWYAKDAGKSTIREIVALLKKNAAQRGT